MKIYELIEKLQEFNSDNEIVVYISDEESEEILSKREIVDVQERIGRRIIRHESKFLEKNHISIDIFGETE